MTDSTKTAPITEVRQTKPGALAGMNCLIRHNSLRVVLHGKAPIGLECTGCFKTWTVTPVEVEIEIDENVQRTESLEPAEER